MIRDDPRHATKHKAAESAIPDIVIVNDGSNPPSRDILREFFEIEFPPHEWSPGRSANARLLVICLKTSNKRLALCGSKSYAESARFQL